MKLIAVKISRFRGWKNEHRIKLEAPITLIVADNGRGKSSLLNAIEWCLYGAVVTKKGSGIDERQDWELSTRTEMADTEPTRVELEFETPEGLVKVCRQRLAGAKSRKADTFTIQGPDGGVLTDEGADSWLGEAGIPDWETYRRAHCFHQEAARQRVVTASERSAILAALLGLEDDIALRSTIESNRPSKLFTEVDRIFEELNEEAHRALEFPHRRLNELEGQADAIGLGSSQLTKSNAKTLRAILVDRARDLAGRLGLTTDLPDRGEASAVRNWASTWPEIARSSAPALSALESYRRQSSQLDQHIARYEGDDEAWKVARSKLEKERQTGGDEAQREVKVTEAETKLTESTTALQQNNATVKLLVDAKAAVEAAGQKDECPVCETNVPGLAERLEATIDRMRSDEFQALQGAEEDARTALECANSALGKLQELVNDEARARRRVDEQRDELKQALRMGRSTAVHDVFAETKKRREAIGSDIAKLERLASDRDQSIQDHLADSSHLDVIEKWLSASKKAESSIDFSALPEWSKFNEALDELAGFAADLSFLGGLARKVQAERSDDRAAKVNKALGKYYSLITQDDTAIKVNVHVTAQRISYRLVDSSGRLAVPVLNQAAINALSLAALFAQSEDRIGSGSWNLVVLDDPGQSLDSEKQKGLSEAIEKLANSRVLVATVPGRLSDRIQNYVSKRRHIVTLGPWSEADGATVECEEDR